MFSGDMRADLAPAWVTGGGHEGSGRGPNRNEHTTHHDGIATSPGAQLVGPWATMTDGAFQGHWFRGANGHALRGSPSTTSWDDCWPCPDGECTGVRSSLMAR